MGARDPWWPLDWQNGTGNPYARINVEDGRVLTVDHRRHPGEYRVLEYPSPTTNHTRDTVVHSIMELRAHLIWAITGPGKPKDPSEEAPTDADP
ncbi:hypothetical protein [Methylobacterium sp. 285MFTsu5.1]|uniref:hypothetical protein n=1 Tax=Methylobacterium sp. 285MFTsu5.1 TaxID=1172187 RepID=UPI00131A0A1E|nr:hypothetical protein [Methylobacterium sp. 285MFTsu5.1]